MEREITVVVRVSSIDHAMKIRDEIMDAVQMRTTEFHIGMPCDPIKFIHDNSQPTE